MKNIAIINVMTSKSTGFIAGNLYKQLLVSGYNPIFAYAQSSESELKKYPYSYKIGTKLEYRIHKLLALITGLQGYFSVFATYRFLRFLSKQKVDTLFILNIHEWYINEKMLYDYVTKHNLSLVNIMIDEYPYLGRCSFAFECEAFHTGCGKCPSLSTHPHTWFFDKSATIYKMKQKAYSKMRRAVFVAPEFQIEQSKKSPVMKGVKTAILDESIDISLYTPRDTSRLKQELGISNDKIVLLCAAPFSDPRKGCDNFLKLAYEFENDKRFIFVHVGFDVEDIETPSNFIKVGYIYDQVKFSEYLSMADLLIFLSLADTLSNTCIASLACGTPLLCYDISGMPYLGDSSVMTLVPPKNFERLKTEVDNTTRKSCEKSYICRAYAENRYDQTKYNVRLIEIAKNL